MSGATPLSDELDELFTGPLSHCRGTLVTPDDERPFFPASELLDAGRLEDVLDRFGRTRAGGADRRVAASLWSQWYAGTLIPPAVAAGVLRGRVLPLGIDELGVLLDAETARPLAFRLTSQGCVEPDASPFRRFRGLVRDHLDPLVRTLAPHAGLSPDTVWTNAGRYVQWILDELGEMDPSAGDVQRARRLLDEEAWPDGWENPLRGTMRYVEEEGRRIARRRICCLQYLVPDLEGCGELCPLPHVRGDTASSG